MEVGFVWKGIHSNEKGLKIISLPNITTPEKRGGKIIIPGRDGCLTQNDGSYEGEVKTIEFDYFDDKFDDIKQWLTGSGEVTFSNEPDKYYKATIINKISLNQILKKLHGGMVQFDCQPFAYLLDGNNTITLTGLNKIYNPGTYESEPFIRIYGTGDISLYVNSKEIKLNVDDYIEIDTELMQCKKGNFNKNNKMSGDFPIFKVGENNISYTGNVTKIEIIPRWRCI